MTSADRPVIAIAGLSTESSTFSPGHTSAEAFHALRGDDVVAFYPFLQPGLPLRDAAEWHGALMGKALPGGAVPAADYEALATELTERLAALPTLDALYFDIHGAMSVEGLDDAEADLLTRIRAAIGPTPIVSASMDLHGNVSRELAHQTDLVTCYRMAPHEDAGETRERAVRNLVEHLRSGAPRPLKAWVPIPVLLPGEKTSTRLEPAASVYARVHEVEAVEGCSTPRSGSATPGPTNRATAPSRSSPAPTPTRCRPVRSVSPAASGRLARASRSSPRPTASTAPSIGRWPRRLDRSSSAIPATTPRPVARAT
ncbi:hypothetical protein GCM10025867_01370 [Frondihabitans sucicola]|uniref:Microcystin LR degradation protein MlrC N-terminal domain-containing protein n=1 Tax=Frondihabitans sucicola TaxID=1268041 RepID=A0ABN6XW69_9MICO|nr:hypothetical protein GCM10025867_01370 [Frondihabitans sucicola]